MHEYIHSKHNRREGHARRHVKNNGVVPQNDPGYETIFAYDLAGRKTSIQYPADPVTKKYVTVSYEHCPMGVTAVTVNNGASSKDIVQSISYNEFGQMSEVRRGNGSVSYYTYDRKQRLANLKTTAEHNGKTWTVQDVKYSFKTDDSIAEMVNTPDVASDGAVQSSIKYSYQYDGLNRLVRADGSYEKAKVANGQPGVSNVRKFSRGYRYAANGNLTGKTVYDPDTGSVDDDWRYEYRNHAVTGITTTTAGNRFRMGYDAAGNMTAQYDYAKHITKQMRYDSDNRINEVRDAANQVIGSYDYDDQGFRVRKVSKRAVNGADTFIETLSPSMYVTYEKEKTATGRVIRESKKTVNHIYLNGVRIAAVTPDITAVYYLTDQVDSVKVVTNDSGLVVTSHEYLPFGEDWITEGDTKNAPKYNSQELDKESGYYFYNARHYDPEIGRFVTPDTVVDGQLDTQGWNRYMYCRGNPIRYNDPTGHDWRDKVLSGAQSVGEGIKSVGEKVTQPLRNAGEWLREKLQGNVTSSNKTQTPLKKMTNLEKNGVCLHIPTGADSNRVIGSRAGRRDPIPEAGIMNPHFHPGQDYRVGKGTPYLATTSGIVEDTRFLSENDKTTGEGNMIKYRTKDGELTTGMHLSKLFVKKGDKISKGDVIGLTGNSGTYTTGAHLHEQKERKTQEGNQVLDVIEKKWIPKEQFDPQSKTWKRQ